MATIAKPRRASKPKTDSPPIPPIDPRPMERDYHPELAEWNWHQPKQPREFAITETPYGQHFPICTIRVDDSFTESAALDIARLMSYAPRLWQILAEMTRWVAAESLAAEDEINQMAEAWLVLRNSAGRNPFEPPDRCTDEELFRKFNHPKIVGRDPEERRQKALEVFPPPPDGESAAR
jgi:hypothetical protein